jgi:hypothetical protein
MTFNDHATAPAAVVGTSPRPPTPSSAAQAGLIARSNCRLAADHIDATVEAFRAWLNAEYGVHASSGYCQVNRGGLPCLYPRHRFPAEIICHAVWRHRVSAYCCSLLQSSQSADGQDLPFGCLA